MLYAREVIELMGAYPGREFRVKEVIRYVAHGRALSQPQRHAMRIAVRRALEALAEAGSVIIKPPPCKRGGIAYYSWKSDT